MADAGLAYQTSLVKENKMNVSISHRIRLGSLALGISGLLFTLFPLVRPFFPKPSGNSPAEFTVVGQTYVMPTWVGSHLIAMIALVLLLLAMLTLHAYLSNGPGERRAFASMIFGLAGIALILPTLGVETYALPVLGRAYLDGKADLSSILPSLYGGPDNMVMILGLLLLAIGGILVAVAIWSSATLPKWAGVILAAGLLLWFPLFPQIIRIIDGLLIGISGIWLAWSIWSNTERMPAKATIANAPVACE
jgi:hypothetical protein